MFLIRLYVILAFIVLSPSVIFGNSSFTENESSSTFASVQSVSRFSDLDNNVYFFNVVLDNKHTFKLEVSLEELLNQSIYVNQPYQVISEEFDPFEPGLSNFVYSSLDTQIELRGKFPSINFHWSPQGSEEIITVTKKNGYRAMGYNYSMVYFSDGYSMNEYDTFNNTEEGDQFFKVQPFEDSVNNKPIILVSLKEGRVIENRKTQRFIPINW